MNEIPYQDYTSEDYIHSDISNEVINLTGDLIEYTYQFLVIMRFGLIYLFHYTSKYVYVFYLFTLINKQMVIYKNFTTV